MVEANSSGQTSNLSSEEMALLSDPDLRLHCSLAFLGREELPDHTELTEYGREIIQMIREANADLKRPKRFGRIDGFLEAVSSTIGGLRSRLPF